MIADVLLVGLGGFFGAASRFSFSKLIKYFDLHPIISTLGVNVLGCFCITFIYGLIASKSSLDSKLLLLLIVGFLGSFTTFSTFSLESLLLFNKGFYYLSLGNIVMQFAFCFAAAITGAKISGVI